jgi:HEAT repeat protein
MLAPPPLPRTLEASIRDLASTKPPVRASAVSDLVRHAVASDGVRARAIPLLEAALKDEVNAVRSAAAVGLADLRAHEALASLLVAIEDADQHVRQMALSALGEIGDARALARLKRALGDERPEMRYQAVIAYARVAVAHPDHRDDVEAALLRAFDDADAAVRYIAMRVAEDYALGGEDPLRSDAIAARARAFVEGKDEAMAVVAAIYLAKIGDGSAPARATLLRVIRRELKTPEPEDEQTAVELAGELGMKNAIADLEKRAWGLGRFLADTCGWHAKIALARLGQERATREILADLDSWRRETRQAAVVAAGRARIAEARAKIAAMDPMSVDPDLVNDALARLG